MTSHGDHVCTYPYPSWQEAQPAVGVVLSKLRGEEVELNCLVHCGYTVAGFAASMAFPHSPEHGAEPTDPGDGALRERAALEALDGWDGQSRMAVDWISIVKFVLPLVIEWIKNRRQ